MTHQNAPQAVDPDDPGADATDVVAIDGPSGSGKSSVARALAQELGFRYLDTGAMYRAVTWMFLLNQVPVLGGEDAARNALDLERLLDSMQLDLTPDGRVMLAGEDITGHIRSREVESRVSAVSAMPTVRQRMRRMQRKQALGGPIVAEGRDMGSIVFPAARWKVFLDADPEERARRRLEDFRERGREVTHAEVLDEILVRDRLDSNRRDAPLMRARGAYYFDTSGHTKEGVIQCLASFVRGEELPDAALSSSERRPAAGEQGEGAQ